MREHDERTYLGRAERLAREAEQGRNGFGAELEPLPFIESQSASINSENLVLEPQIKPGFSEAELHEFYR